MDQASSLRKIVNKNATRIKKESSVRRQASSRPPRVISITSGKGGVGKTNITGNLAIALTRLGHRVLVLDADLGLANIDIIFGVHPTHNIGHVINGEKRLSEVIMEGPQGIQIVPAGSGFVNLTHLTEGQKLSLLSEFEDLDDVLDFLLIDTSAGISENVLYFNLAADDCVIIATSEPTSITDAYAMMKVMSADHGLKHFKLLVNMVPDEAEAKAVYLNLSQASDRFLNGVVIEYVGFISSDESVKNAVRKRKPVLELYPGSAASQRITEMAKSLQDWSRRTDADGNLKFFLKRYIEYRAVG